MDKYYLEETKTTPLVMMDPQSGELIIRGRSIPENAIAFYNPIFDWVDKYLENPQPQTRVRIRFEYINTSSSKCFFDLLKKFKTLHEKGSDLLIEWHHEEEDEDMLECGEDFEDVLGIPFKYIEFTEGEEDDLLESN